MAKLRNPFLGLSASGSISRALTYLRRMRHQIVEKTPTLKDQKTTAQLSWRHMFLKVVALWHALSAAEKAEWESAARPKHMTGYAWFVSQALRPNPGIYLPLQGGTMQGTIAMDGNELEDLPDPTQDQDAATKKYHDDNLPPGGYTAGTRVYHSANQTIPDTTLTALAFDSEDYDTDVIHDLVTNNTRLTCKTAGKYLIIGQVQWWSTAGGQRRVDISLNGTRIAMNRDQDAGGFAHTQIVATIYDLAVNEYVELKVYHSQGAPLLAAAPMTLFMMQRIG